MDKTRCRHCEKPIWFGEHGWAHIGGQLHCIIHQRGRVPAGQERQICLSKHFAEPLLTSIQKECLGALLPWEWRSLKEVALRTNRSLNGVSHALGRLVEKRLAEAKGEDLKERAYRRRET